MCGRSAGVCERPRVVRSFDRLATNAALPAVDARHEGDAVTSGTGNTYGCMVSSRAHRGVCRTMGGTLRDARGVTADVGFGVAEPVGDHGEAAFHFVRCLWAGSAVGSGHGVIDEVGIVERLAREQESCALGEHQVAMPFGLAETGPAITPGRFEFRGAADAVEAGDASEESGEPRDKHGDRREPALAGRVDVVFGMRCLELHGLQCKCAVNPAESGCGLPSRFETRRLKGWGKRVLFPPDLDNDFPPSLAHWTAGREPGGPMCVRPE